MPTTADDILRTSDPSLLGADPVAGFRALARAWHPDTCKDPKAREVFAHLTQLRDRALHGAAPAEEHVAIPGGQIVWREREIVVVPGRADPLFTALRDASPDVAKRLPVIQSATPEALILARPPDSVPLAAVQRRFPGGVPVRHVAWMASRLYELVYVSHGAAGVVWGGLLPESLCVLVGDHGVIPLDGRFLARVGARMATAPAELVPLVPTDRAASTAYAFATVSRIALILLGDPSGTGNALLMRAKTDPAALPPALLAWFRTAPGKDPGEFYRAYRRTLENCFGPPKYHKLEL